MYFQLTDGRITADMIVNKKSFFAAKFYVPTI
jgi:hypothetical protein